MLRPERLIELTYRSRCTTRGDVKKVARYQQYFAIRRTMARVRKASRPSQGRRDLADQRSGKSLTMVMLAKALALEPRRSRTPAS